MKNQYIGDIGDYGKYGLLRFLALRGVKIGVNWYLTENDYSSDGEKTDYLKDEAQAVYDDFVFYRLKRIVEKGKYEKRIQDVEAASLIPNAKYYNEVLDTSSIKDRKERYSVRNHWHRSAMATLKNDTDLIFADPDNGTLRQTSKPSINNGEKYTTLDELADYYNAGKDVVYYCHKARRSEDKWIAKTNELKEKLPEVRIVVLTFRRGSQRSYIFGIHPESVDNYEKHIAEFLKTDWCKISVGKKNIPFVREQ